MIGGIGLMIYACICLFSGTIEWLNTEKKSVLALFLMAHFLCFFVGLLQTVHNIPLLLIIIVVLLAWASRILNGYFIFHHVHLTHHLLTAVIFTLLIYLSTL